VCVCRPLFKKLSLESLVCAYMHMFFLLPHFTPFFITLSHVPLVAAPFLGKATTHSSFKPRGVEQGPRHGQLVLSKQPKRDDHAAAGDSKTRDHLQRATSTAEAPPSVSNKRSGTKDKDDTKEGNKGVIIVRSVIRNLTCPVCREPVQNLGTVHDDRLDEISGMELSEKFDDILYAVNDSPKGPAVYAVSTNGTVMATLTLDLPTPTDEDRFGKNGWGDWETIVLGPCRGGSRSGRCLFAGDIGQNCVRASEHCNHLRPVPPSLIQFQEPDKLGDATIAAERIPFVFPGGEQIDAEALMAYGDDLFIFSKEDNNATRLFRFPPIDTVASPLELTQIAVFHLQPGERVTGAVGKAGIGFIWRTLENVQWLDITDLANIVADSAASCILPFALYPLEPQGESIVWKVTTDGKWEFFTTSEGMDQSIHKITCMPPPS